MIILKCDGQNAPFINFLPRLYKSYSNIIQIYDPLASISRSLSNQPTNSSVLLSAIFKES